MSQPHIRDADAVIVISGGYSRITVKYGKHGIGYAHIEVGCAAENIYPQVMSLGIGTCAVGVFEDEEVAAILDLPVNEEHCWYCLWGLCNEPKLRGNYY